MPATVVAHEIEARLVKLEGANNFRDLGGWQSADGRSVVRGRVFRAGTLHALTTADRARIAALGLTDVVDLRSESEQARYPTVWPNGAAPRLWAQARDQTQGDLSRLIQDKVVSAAEFRAAMEQAYDRLPLSLGSAYRHILHTLIDDATTLFHCTAGKDRTGVGSAILLAALDVDREQIGLDYLLTNHSHRVTLERFAREHRLLEVERRAPGSLDIIFTAHPAYLDRTFTMIEARFGGIEGYLREVLGIDAADRERLKDRLLV